MISILLPSRRRSVQLERMVNSLRDTCSVFPEIVVYIDEDDTTSIEKAQTLDIKTIIGPRLMFTDYWNKCYEKSTGDILMMAADDLIFRTKDWDKSVEEAFSQYKDRVVLVYGDDKDIKMQVPSHPFIHRRWAETVGYFSPPYFTCGSCDYWLYEIAKFLGRKHFVHSVVEHMHYTAGKSLMDETYWERAISNEERTLVSMQYSSLALERLEQAGKLQAVIDSYGVA